jgi:hypothetical protein
VRTNSSTHPRTWDLLDVRDDDGVYGLNICVVFLIRSRINSDNNGIRNSLLHVFELAFQLVNLSPPGWLCLVIAVEKAPLNMNKARPNQRMNVVWILPQKCSS